MINYKQWDLIIDIITIYWLLCLLFKIELFSITIDLFFFTNLFVIFMKNSKSCLKTNWIDFLLAIPFLRIIKICKFLKFLNIIQKINFSRFLKIIQKINFSKILMFKNYFEKTRAIVSLFCYFK